MWLRGGGGGAAADPAPELHAVVLLARGDLQHGHRGRVPVRGARGVGAQRHLAQAARPGDVGRGGAAARGAGEGVGLPLHRLHTAAGRVQ